MGGCIASGDLFNFYLHIFFCARALFRDSRASLHFTHLHFHYIKTANFRKYSHVCVYLMYARGVEGLEDSFIFIYMAVVKLNILIRVYTST